MRSALVRSRDCPWCSCIELTASPNVIRVVRSVTTRSSPSETSPCSTPSQHHLERSGDGGNGRLRASNTHTRVSSWRFLAPSATPPSVVFYRSSSAVSDTLRSVAATSSWALPCVHTAPEPQGHLHHRRPAGGISVIESSPYADRFHPTRRSQVSAGATVRISGGGIPSFQDASFQPSNHHADENGSMPPNLGSIGSLWRRAFCST